MNDRQLFFVSLLLYGTSRFVYDVLRNLGTSILVAGVAAFAVMMTGAVIITLTWVNLFE